MKRRKRKTARLQAINPRAAGIDVGSTSHWVAVDPALDDKPVRQFGAYTGDLHELADWLVDCGVLTVAMEATGIYWVGLFEILRERGLQVCLVDARSTKQVAGRKSDISDCQWIQQLHAYGLLRSALIPPEQIGALRSYMRQRDRWVTEAARSIQHMQQALELMNVKLTEVISDITGATGIAIIDDILAGQRDPEKLAEHRLPGCKRSKEEIARALYGSWRDEHLFALRQAREHYLYLGDRIADCDQRIEATLRSCTSPDATDPPPPTKSKKDGTHHPFRFDARAYCFRLAGVDLTSIDGLAVNTVLTVLSEVGPDMAPWRSDRAFGSWLGLAPHLRKSGKRILACATRPNAQRAATAFRLAAAGLANSKSALGAFYRRLRARIGAPKAITATAYKIARILYRVLKTKKPYDDVGQVAYDQRFHQRRLRSAIRMARDLGYRLVPAQGPVS